jgi:hypothetical protein
MECEYIYDGANNLICIISRTVHTTEAVNFIKRENAYLEVGLMNRGPQSPVKLHKHMQKKVPSIRRTEEVIIQLDGLLKLVLYADNKDFAKEIELVGPSVIILISGYHSFDFLSPTNLIEVKTGPYQNKQDKEYFIGNNQ